MNSTAFNPATSRDTDLGAVKHSVLARIQNWRAKRREYTRIYDELTRMGAREMDELGISPADFHSIANGTFHRD
ncbi:MAG: hypothetical protein ACTS3R_04550 [Inquilinaceae bacterium]